MEYSILVRPDFLEQHLKGTEKDVKAIRRGKYPSDVKLALYRQQNYRRRMLKESPGEIKVKAPPRHTHASTPAPTHTLSSAPTPVPTGEELIVSSLPKSHQRAGASLIKHLQSIPDLKVNEKGEIEYQGETAHGSRIFDLVHDFIRKRNRPPATGYELLAKALRDHNTPRELITNQDRWLDIEYSTSPRKKGRRQRHQTGSGCKGIRHPKGIRQVSDPRHPKGVGRVSSTRHSKGIRRASSKRQSSGRGIGRPSSSTKRSKGKTLGKILRTIGWKSS